MGPTLSEGVGKLCSLAIGNGGVAGKRFGRRALVRSQRIKSERFYLSLVSEYGKISMWDFLSAQVHNEIGEASYNREGGAA